MKIKLYDLKEIIKEEVEFAFDDLKKNLSESKSRKVKNINENKIINRVKKRIKLREYCYQAIQQSRLKINQIIESKNKKVLKEITNINVLESFFIPVILQKNNKLLLNEGFDLIKKANEIIKIFSKFPEKWEEFKDMIGVAGSSIKETVIGIKKWYTDGNKKLNEILRNSGEKLLDMFPKIRVFLYVAKNLPSVSSVLQNTKKRLPQPLQSILDKVSKKAESFLSLVKKFFEDHAWLKPVDIALRGYLYYTIWMNVSELSWNIPEIIRGMLGGMSWEEIIDSLPESGLGFIIGKLFGSLLPIPFLGEKAADIGINWLLVGAIVAQLLWYFRKAKDAPVCEIPNQKEKNESILFNKLSNIEKIKIQKLINELKNSIQDEEILNEFIGKLVGGIKKLVGGKKDAEQNKINPDSGEETKESGEDEKSNEAGFCIPQDILDIKEKLKTEFGVEDSMYIGKEEK